MAIREVKYRLVLDTEQFREDLRKALRDATSVVREEDDD